MTYCHFHFHNSKQLLYNNAIRAPYPPPLHGPNDSLTLSVILPLPRPLRPVVHSHPTHGPYPTTAEPPNPSITPFGPALTWRDVT